MHQLVTSLSRRKTKDEFYPELSWLLHCVRLTDVVVVPGDFKAKPRNMVETEQQRGCRIYVPANRTENKDRLNHVCSYHRLLLETPIFVYKTKVYFKKWPGAVLGNDGGCGYGK